MDKQVQNISIQMMEVIASAKECTPVIYDNPEDQQKIIEACKVAAKAVFAFKDATSASRGVTDTPVIVEATVRIERTAESLIEVIKKTEVVTVEPKKVQDLQQSIDKLLSITSMLKIFLSQLRISSNLQQLSNAVVEDVRGPVQMPTTGLPSQPIHQLSSVEEWLEGELRKEDPFMDAPWDLSVVQEGWKRAAKWLTDRTRKEYQTRKNMEFKVNELQTKLELEKTAFSEFRDKSVRAFQEQLSRKDEDIRAKMLELQRIGALYNQALQNQTESETPKTVVSVSGSKNKDQVLLEQEKEIAALVREKTELIQKYNNSISNLEAYANEVENWKKEVTESFGQKLIAKDTELRELRDTIELLMKKDETREQEDLMNNLLDFINTSGTAKSSSSTNLNLSAPPAPISPTQSKENVSNTSNSGTMRNKNEKKKIFKVLLPNNDGFISVEQTDAMTLGNVLEIVIQKRQLGNIDDFGFQHINSAPQSPYIKLSTKLKELSVTSVRLVKKEKRPTLAAEKSDPNIGAPYLVFHTEHKTVEDLIRMMEKHIEKVQDDKEELPTDGLVSPAKGFEIELGSKKVPRLEETSTLRLVDTDKNTPYYQFYFLNKPHVNYYGESSNRVGPVIVSLELPDKTSDDGGERMLRALVRTKFDDEWVFISAKEKKKKKPLLKAIETQCRNGDKISGIKLKKINHMDAPKELSIMEQKLMTKGYKFGLLYSKSGQTDEDDMFANVNPSPEFEEFLAFLGDKVVLKGWNNYRGGLDVKNDSTGTHSVYTKHCGYEIMFHVSTLLPYYEKDKQQLERKRHLGNDVCVIIFKDVDDNKFSPDTIKSEFNHVFCVISKVSGKGEATKYKVSMAYKGGVGMSQPLLPYPAVFEKTPLFRDFLLTKLINSERCAMYAPSFITKISKTKELQMQAIIDEFKNAFRE